MNKLNTIQRFREKFPYDTFVSAHQDWTYEAVEQFILYEQNRLIDDLRNKVCDDCKERIKI